MKKILILVFALVFLSGAFFTVGAETILESLIVFKTVLETSGQHHAIDATSTTVPGGVSSALDVAVRGRSVAGDNSIIVSPGHKIGVHGHCDAVAPGFVDICIGTEGYVTNSGGANIPSAVGLASHFAANNGVANWYGVDSLLGKVDGTLGESVAFRARADMSSANVGLFSGLRLEALQKRNGQFGNIYGMEIKDQGVSNDSIIAGIFMENQTGTNPVKYFGYNDCPACQLYTRGDLVQAGANSGVIAIKAPQDAGANTITWPAASGTPLLDTTLMVKTGKFTRAGDAPSGPQAITGLGGKPISIEIQMTNNTSFVESSFGFTDCTNDYVTANSSGIVVQQDELVLYNQGGTGINLQAGQIDTSNGSCDSDGFTINWVKVGAPPADNLVMTYKAIVKAG